jgi:hypothetical protein
MRIFEAAEVSLQDALTKRCAMFFRAIYDEENINVGAVASLDYLQPRAICD